MKKQAILLLRSKEGRLGGGWLVGLVALVGSFWYGMKARRSYCCFMSLLCDAEVWANAYVSGWVFEREKKKVL